MAVLSSDWLGSEVMLACVTAGCGCEELLLERAGAPVPLDCSVSARENERVGGRSHTRMQEGFSKQQLLRIGLPTFHTARSSRSIDRTVVRYALLLLLRQHGEQARAETQAGSVTTDSSPRSRSSERWLPRRQEELTCLQLLTAPPAAPGSGSGTDTSIGEDEKSEAALLSVPPPPTGAMFRTKVPVPW